MRFLRSSSLFWSFPALLLLLDFSASMDLLNQTQVMSGSDTLISAGGKFQLGFFTLGNPSNSYLGIWFYKIPSSPIVWVANRDKPLEGSSGVLMIEHGNLVIQNNSSRTVWSSGTGNLSSSGITAQLLDSGNLVLKYDDSGSYLWQSFDDPTDTMLAGLKIGWDFKAGIERYLSSWKSEEDPSPGQFSFRMDSHGFPQFKLFEGNITRYRSFPLLGNFHRYYESVDNLNLTYSSHEAYYSYGIQDPDILSRQIVNYTGKLQFYIWNNKTLDWMSLFDVPADSCDDYAQCGPNTICDTMHNVRSCKCLPGYVPKAATYSDTLDIWYPGGCTRKSPLNCSTPEGFKQMKWVKLPDLLQFSMNINMTLKKCETLCMRNCSCTAYVSAIDSRDRRICGLWYGDLLDMMKEVNGHGYEEFFVRVMASELEGNSMRWRWVVAVAVVLLVSCAIFCLWATWRRRKRQGAGFDDTAVEEENFELPTFDAVVILQATNNFSHSNMIGEGGFGPVYKGLLPNGQEIAVKKLSKFSRQGVSEFTNEVMLIAKLQHRNLVKLLGCCIQGEERMLVYEYMPNGSLDTFIFSKAGGNCLVWRRRFDIIVGVARGLLYLHRDSRLTIIHRDLKASNVLLDSKMNPKISDFGMARAFGEDQFSEKTKMIVGTLGYMSPEYAINGLFSVKSDVFSFGVLVLEIVSGKSNRKFHHPDHSFNLLGHAWKQWITGKAHELIDARMEDSFPLSEVMRCIQIGLLCVQKHPEDRPTMSVVLLMLDSESAALPQPKEPGFYSERSSADGSDMVTIGREHCTNEISSTLLEGR